jgi:hypothetical protein
MRVRRSGTPAARHDRCTSRCTATAETGRGSWSPSGEAHEQRLLVKQPDAVARWMHFEPRLKRLLDRLGDGNLTLPAALAAHVEPVEVRVAIAPLLL